MNAIKIYIIIFVFAISVLQVQSQTCISTGLAAHWKLDEATGPTAYDAVGSNHGTISGSPVYSVTGVVDTGFDMDNDNIAAATVTYSTGTVSFWINIDYVPQERWIVSQSDLTGGGGDEKYIAFQIFNSKFRLETYLPSSSSRVSMDTTLTQGEWYHVVWTSNGSTWKGYLNGVEKTLTVDYGSNDGAWFDDVPNPHSLNIGSFLGGQNFVNGKMDEVRIYDGYVLSSSEISTLYAGCPAPTPTPTATHTPTPTPTPGPGCLTPGLAAHWKLDEATGPTAYDTVGSNDGTISGSPVYSVTGVIDSAFDMDNDNIAAATVTYSTGTVSFWINIDYLPQERWIVSQSDINNDNFLAFQIYNSKFRLESIINSSIRRITMDAALTTGTWYNVVWTSDGSTWKGYLNGFEKELIEDEGTNNGIWFNDVPNSHSINIGSNLDSSNYVNGKIDDVRIYNGYVLSDSEVISLYYDCNPPSCVINGLSAYWTLDDASGTTAIDSLGANNGIISGTPSFGVVGKAGDSIDFDGINDTISAAPISNATGSVAFWIKPESTSSEQSILSQSNSSGNDFLAFQIYSSKFRIEKTSSTRIQVGNENITTGEWYHVVWISTGSTWKVYLDGQLQSLTATAGSNNGSWFNDVTSPTSLNIGSFKDTSKFFDGILDDIRIYDGIELTEDEIDDLIFGCNNPPIATHTPTVVPTNTPTPTPTFTPTPTPTNTPTQTPTPLPTCHIDGLNAHWKLDDISGATIAIDSAGSNDGTINGNPTLEASGQVSTSFDFDGSGDSISASTISHSSGTVAFWVKPETTAEQWIVSQSNSSYTNFLAFQIHSSKFRIEKTSSYRATIGDTITAGEWYHVAWTSDGSTWKGYINGDEKSLNFVNGSNAGLWFDDVPSPASLSIGALDGCCAYMNGNIDDIRIYKDVVLTESEIELLYLGCD